MRNTQHQGLCYIVVRNTLWSSYLGKWSVVFFFFNKIKHIPTTYTVIHIYPNKHKKFHACMFIVSLFLFDKDFKSFKCPSNDEWLSRQAPKDRLRRNTQKQTEGTHRLRLISNALCWVKRARLQSSVPCGCRTIWGMIEDGNGEEGWPVDSSGDHAASWLVVTSRLSKLTNMT